MCLHRFFSPFICICLHLLAVGVQNGGTGPALYPAPEALLKICPLFCFLMTGRTARVTRISPKRLTSNILRIVSSLVSSKKGNSADAVCGSCYKPYLWVLIFHWSSVFHAYFPPISTCSYPIILLRLMREGAVLFLLIFNQSSFLLLLFRFFLKLFHNWALG